MINRKSKTTLYAHIILQYRYLGHSFCSKSFLLKSFNLAHFLSSHISILFLSIVTCSENMIVWVWFIVLREFGFFFTLHPLDYNKNGEKLLPNQSLKLKHDKKWKFQVIPWISLKCSILHTNNIYKKNNSDLKWYKRCRLT